MAGFGFRAGFGAFAMLTAPLLFAMGSGCGGADDGDTPSGGSEPVGPVAKDYEVVVPFASPVKGIDTQNANNNLDVVKFKGRTYLAWRTAPTHFASADTVMYVASEGDDGWRFEGKFAIGTDLREPRFLTLGDRLFLYMAVLGTDPYKFEPQGTIVSEYHGPDDWDEPLDTYVPGFILWRAREIDGKAYILGYEGGENIYEFDGEPIQIHFLTTTDGVTLEPIVEGKPVVLKGGVSETDFSFLDDGSLVAVGRNEAGDKDHGFGSVICTAPKNALADWTCSTDKKKYDSPLVFRNSAGVWLVGRRNISEDGNYDLGHSDKSLEDQAGEYEVDYSFKPKRCSLWKVDPVTKSVAFVDDFPSRGDTCFASATRESDADWTIYNYTSVLDGASDCKSWPDDCADITWFVGQGGPTMIYRVGVTLPGGGG